MQNTKKFPIKGQKKVMYIVRGLPGSGISTLSRSLHTDSSSIVISFEKFFQPNNSSEETAKITLTTEKFQCAQEKFQNFLILAMEQKFLRIILDRPNILMEELCFYTKLADEYCYNIEILHTKSTWSLSVKQLCKITKFAYSENFMKAMKNKYHQDITLSAVMKYLKKSVCYDNLMPNLFATYVAIDNLKLSEVKKKKKKAVKSNPDSSVESLFVQFKSQNKSKSINPTDSPFEISQVKDVNLSFNDYKLLIDLNMAIDIILDYFPEAEWLIAELVNISELHLPLDQDLKEIFAKKIHDFVSRLIESRNEVGSTENELTDFLLSQCGSQNNVSKSKKTYCERFPVMTSHEPSNKISEPVDVSLVENSTHSQAQIYASNEPKLSDCVTKTQLELTGVNETADLTKVYLDLRDEVDSHRHLCSYYHAKRQEAIQKKVFGAASFYSEQAHLHSEKRKNAHFMACHTLMKQRYVKATTTAMVDLHQLSMDEALEMVKCILSPSDYGFPAHRRGAFTIITGKGKHSINSKAVLKPAVISLLKKNKIKYEDSEEGTVKIYFE